MNLRTLVTAIGVEYRKAQTVLESGHADSWVPAGEGSGRHRDFEPGAAFAFGLLMRLRLVGVSTPRAVEVVKLVEESLRGVAQALVWDHQFAPFRGKLQTTHKWLIEIADGELVRLGTDANPSRASVEWFPWQTLRRSCVENPRPVVTVRLDLSRLGELVASVA